MAHWYNVAEEPHKAYSTRDDAPYQYVRDLGAGTSGIIYEVKCVRGPCAGLRFARKIVQQACATTPDARRRIEDEVRIIRMLRHQHITRVQATYSTPTEFVLLMLPVAERDLRDWIFDFDVTPRTREEWAARCRTIPRWCECLVCALDYIHSQKIRHKDIKPANILVLGETILIADFGIATEFVNQVDSATPMYAAPEQLGDDQRGGTGTDVFALGCVFLEMLTVFFGIAPCNFADHWINPSGLRAFNLNKSKIVQWFVFLSSTDQRCEWITPDHRGLLTLAFFMMCPNPRRRINVRTILNTTSPGPHSYEADSFNTCPSCDGTRHGSLRGFSSEVNLPILDSPSNALRLADPQSWTEAQSLWTHPLLRAWGPSRAVDVPRRRLSLFVNLACIQWDLIFLRTPARGAPNEALYLWERQVLDSVLTVLKQRETLLALLEFKRQWAEVDRSRPGVTEELAERRFNRIVEAHLREKRMDDAPQLARQYIRAASRWGEIIAVTGSEEVLLIDKHNAEVSKTVWNADAAKFEQLRAELSGPSSWISEACRELASVKSIVGRVRSERDHTTRKLLGDEMERRLASVFGANNVKRLREVSAPQTPRYETEGERARIQELLADLRPDPDEIGYRRVVQADGTIPQAGFIDLSDEVNYEAMERLLSGAD
ncbi:MAG: hypothetical protein M1832_001252 [Thelocarpon impressellum]|nr:MAG: hypothetical protein M1832_001252 [Thelocarpon impressellum]